MKTCLGLVLASMGCATSVFGADEVEIIAPDSSATVRAADGHSGRQAIVDGWSCGADVVEDAVTVLAELGRRRAILSRQVDAGRALARAPAIQNEPDRQRRLRTFDDALRTLSADAPTELRAITRKQELALQKFDGFSGLRTYNNSRATFGSGGITDGGATEIRILPDCFQTIHVETLAAQIRGAATEISDLRDDLRQVRDAVASGAGV